MHNLSTVFRFEVMRTLKKKTFWIMALAFPLLIGAIMAIVFFSNKTTEKAVNDTKNQQFSIGLTDKSEIVNPEILNAYKIQTIADRNTGIAKVAQEKLDAYFYVPADLTKQTIEIHALDVGLFNNSRYQAVVSGILSASASDTVSPDVAAILQNLVKYESTTYKDGKKFDGFKQVIAPGIFLVLFYLLIAFFGNQMLTSTTEEKENRVIEMILTTIEARTLIIGKLLSLFVLSAIQIGLILVPIVLAYVFARSQLSLPSIDLTSIPLNPARIAIGFGLFLSSFLFFTGILTGIGAAVPTAKEAGGFLGVVMIAIFGPLYAVSLFVSSPGTPLVTFLSYFPLTAPIPLMLRNAVGNLSYGGAILGIVILSVCAVIALSVAIRLFRYGALEYSRRLNLLDLFRRKS
jgi:ABC-2 type transport system permease protein